MLSGTKEGIEAISEGRVLVIPNREVWESDKPFAILALKTKNHGKEKEIKNLVAKIHNLEKDSNRDSEKEKDLQSKKSELDKLDNLRHRIDLVRIEEGYENLVTDYGKETEKPKSEEKQFIIGFDNQETAEKYQAQIEIPPKK